MWTFIAWFSLIVGIGLLTAGAFFVPRLSLWLWVPGMVVGIGAALMGDRVLAVALTLGGSCGLWLALGVIWVLKRAAPLDRAQGFPAWLWLGGVVVALGWCGVNGQIGYGESWTLLVVGMVSLASQFRNIWSRSRVRWAPEMWLAAVVMNLTLGLGSIGLISGNLSLSPTALWLSLPALVLAAGLTAVSVLFPQQKTARLVGSGLVVLQVVYFMILWL